MDSFEPFNEDHFPPKDAFYSFLMKESISDEDYAHSQDISQSFEMVDLAEYHNLYLHTDVLLLADVLESFRDMCIIRSSS